MPEDMYDAEDAAEAKRLKLDPLDAARVRRERAAARMAERGVGPSGAVEGPKMLPGMAMIAVFVLLYALLNVFSALQGKFGTGAGRYAVLGICTLLVVGVFGLLRLRRWGWALVLGGTLFIAMYLVSAVLRAHLGIAGGMGYLVYAGFFTLFFLYLVRDEVRVRVK